MCVWPGHEWRPFVRLYIEICEPQWDSTAPSGLDELIPLSLLVLH